MATASERLSAARQKALEKKFELETRSPKMSKEGLIGIFVLLGGTFSAGLALGYLLWVVL